MNIVEDSNNISTLINLQNNSDGIYHGNAATSIHTMLIRLYVMFKLIYRSYNKHYINIYHLFLQQSMSGYMVTAVK